MSNYPVQVVTLPRCPKCLSERVPMYAKSGRIQYRRCKCGVRFKTIKEFAPIQSIGKDGSGARDGRAYK